MSNAEVQMHQARPLPIWAKSKVFAISPVTRRNGFLLQHFATCSSYYFNKLQPFGLVSYLILPFGLV
jgi:hypothetical protein